LKARYIIYIRQMSDMAFALFFCCIQTCCQIGKRQEEKGNIIILRTDFYSKKLCENLFIKQIKCTFAIDMVTEAKGITIISKL
jgi:hypothetical protein